MELPFRFLITPLSRESITRFVTTALCTAPAQITATANATPFSVISRLKITALLLALNVLAALTAHAQDLGDFIISEKTASTGRVTPRYWPKGSLTLWGTTSGSLPSRIIVGSGLSLGGSPLTLTASGGGGGGDALTSGTLAQFATTTSAQLRGVLSDESGSGVFLTANGNGSALTGLTHTQVSGLGTLATQSGTISDYLTTATAASTYAPLASPTFTGTVTIPSGASIADYVTTAEPYILGVLTWEHPNTTLGTQTSTLTIPDEQEAMAWQTPAESGRLLTSNSSLNGSNISSGTVAAARLGSGSSITTKYLRGDNTWQTIGGGGDALTSGTLDQFADVTQTATKTLAITESTTLAGGIHSGTNTGDQTTITGNAGTATALQTARAINGVNFDGTAAITVTAAAGTLTGTTLASNVVTSSLTGVGTLATGVWQATAIADSYISSATTWNAKQAGDADLTTYAGITPSANVQSLLGAVDYSAMRTLLGLVIGTNVQAYDTDLADLADGSLTGTLVAAASTSARGSVELATDGETAASVAVQGNDTRLVNAGKVEIGLAISDETTALTTGTAKLTFRMPHAMTVTAVRLSLTTVSSSGTPTVDINEGGTTILSTKLSCDVSEKTSTTAATAAVISDTALADDAEITIDIDTAGTGATGAKVWIIGTR